jgi:hypothetical protein
MEVYMSQKSSAVKRAQQSEARPHQPGQEVFKAILSEDIEWKPFPAFPPSVRQVTAIGPLGLEYLSANDDPRNNRS